MRFVIVLVLIFSHITSMHAVTLQEVQKDPTNITLNLNYAAEQEAMGNVKNAMVTIERLILLYPNDVNLNLYYIRLLLKLGSFQKATPVIEQLLASDNANEEIKSQLEQLVADSKKSQFLDKIAIDGYIRIGISNHSNINDTSTHNQFYTSGSLSSYPAGTVRQDNTYDGSVGLNFTYTHDDKNITRVSTSFSKQDQRRDKNSMYDLSALSVTQIHTQENYQLGSTLSYSHKDNKYNFDTRTIGATLFGTYFPSSNHIYNTSYRIAESKNNHNSIYGGARDKNSVSHTTNFGYTFLPTPKDRINVSSGYNYSDAQTKYNKYHGYTAGLGYTHTFNKHFNLSTSVNRTENNYYAPDSLVLSTTSRKDRVDVLSLNLTGSITDTWSYALRYSNTDTKSNITNYTYNKDLYSLSFTKSFSLLN